MTLPTYDPSKRCPQCGWNQVSVRYLDDNEHECQNTYAPLAYEGARTVCHYHRGSHFHRRCGRCGFRWAEAVGAPSMAYYSEPGEREP